MCSDDANSNCILLIPGMAADASVFAAQTAALPEVRVVEWIEPLPRESLASYASRLAERVHAPPGCVLGGASFGGIVAIEMARRLNPRCIVLIGSVASPAELPLRIRLLRPFAPMALAAPVRVCQWLVGSLNGRWMKRSRSNLAAIAKQFCNADPRLLRWSLDALLRWRAAPTIICPVLCVHGDRDPIFPLPPSNKHDYAVVHGGGHVISLSHPKEVSDFLSACLVKTSHNEAKA